MSKSSSRHKHPARHITKHTQEQIPHPIQKRNKHFVLLIVIAILAAIPFSMGRYFELNYPDPFDSGAYVYSAKHILTGAKIGVEEKPSAQLGTLLVNILGVWLFGFNETGPKLIQSLMQAAALFLMFVTMRKLFGTLSAAISVIVASVYLSSPLIAKFGNVKEQYMIACMVMGISCFVLYYLKGKSPPKAGLIQSRASPWLALLSGAFVIWAPLFKQTGVSAMAAVALFVVLQSFLKHRTFKQTYNDILLLLAGSLLSLAPACLWLAIIKAPLDYWPYSFVSKPLFSVFESAQPDVEGTLPQTQEVQSDIQPASGGSEKKGIFEKLLPQYVRGSWDILKPQQRKQAALRVLRYYRLLILPIALAIGSIILRIIKIISTKLGKTETSAEKNYDRFVLLFAVWWFLDMAFVWVSPRSYEQYYLPLNVSAVMLGGYIIAAYSYKLKKATSKTTWRIIGLLGFLLMVSMSWHIFFGIKKSPHSGLSYGSARRGYAQKLKEISDRHRRGARGYWEITGEYIRDHSEPTDKIYVWGWVPGIYVKAQRLSPSPSAFEGTMHILPPEELSNRVEKILDSFKEQPPKFIVDTRKNHFPWDRPPLLLWPIVPPPFSRGQTIGFLSSDPSIILAYDKSWYETLQKHVGKDEAERYKVMAPFRKYVMDNYRIAEPKQYVVTSNGQLIHRMFGEHIVFLCK